MQDPHIRFRNHVFERRSSKLGEAVYWRPAYLGRLIRLALVTFSLFFLLALTFPYTERVSLAGVVRPHTEPAILVAAHSGQITELMVGEGTQVLRGQPLIRLDPRTFGMNGVALSELEIKRLKVREAFLQQRLLRGDELHEQRLRQHRASLENSDRELRLFSDQLEHQAQQLKLAQRELNRLTTLADSHMVSDREVGLAESNMLSRQESHAKALLEHERLDAEQGRIAQDIALLEAEWVIQRQELSHELEDVSVNLMRANEGEEFTLLAGIDGVVSDIRFQEGAWVEQGSPVLSIIDPNSRAGVEVHIPGAMIGRVAEGAEVRLSFSGYPVADYGVGKGRLQKPAAVARHARDQPFYRTIVEIDEVPQKVGQLPVGMIVSANVVVASDPVWRWILKPLISFWWSI